MAYVTTNPPALTVQRVGAKGSGGAIWSYASPDALAVVIVAGYFTNGVELGMELGDVVHIFNTTIPLVSEAWVSDVDAADVVTLTDMV